MEDFKKRLQEEQQVLRDKIDKLTVFLNSDKGKQLEENILKAMKEQKKAMIRYEFWLIRRMELLEVPLLKDED
jgi:hypothetical protein